MKKVLGFSFHFFLDDSHYMTHCVRPRFCSYDERDSSCAITNLNGVVDMPVICDLPQVTKSCVLGRFRDCGQFKTNFRDC